MSIHRSILGALTLALTAALPAQAQNPTVSIFARGGGYNALTNLNDAGSADFQKVGFNLGGGIGVRFHPLLTVRGDFTYARNEFRNNTVETGTKLNRFFYDAALQLQYPTASGLQPYLFAGGGAVTLHQVGTSGQDETKPAATFGLGLNYHIPDSPFGLFVEGKSWLYRFEDLSGPLSGFAKTQYEIAWTGGLSYRLPF